MRLTRVKLLNFRNLEKIELDVSPQINIFLGRNGQGKTNLLEAMSFLALGRSHRGSSSRELIRFDAEFFHVRLEGEDARGDSLQLEGAVERNGQKRFKVDGEVVGRRAELLGRLSVVQFHPNDAELTRGAPELRRRFLDYTLSVGSPESLRHLLAYRRAVQQKNRLLKQRRGDVSAELDGWDTELIEHGVRIWSARAELLEAMRPEAERAYRELARDERELKLQLQPSKMDTELPIDEERFAEMLAAHRQRELQLRQSLVGPHRDDLGVDLDGRAIRRFGSQGEQRSAAIALKLAQAELIYERSGERPVVFLDDIFSELDRRRTEALQERLHHEHQLFIATARADDVHGMEAWTEVSASLVQAGRVRPLDRLEDAMEGLHGS